MAQETATCIVSRRPGCEPPRVWDRHRLRRWLLLAAYFLLRISFLSAARLSAIPHVEREGYVVISLREKRAEESALCVGKSRSIPSAIRTAAGRLDGLLVVPRAGRRDVEKRTGL
jgi:hypothetical protein